MKKKLLTMFIAILSVVSVCALTFAACGDKTDDIYGNEQNNQPNGANNGDNSEDNVDESDENPAETPDDTPVEKPDETYVIETEIDGQLCYVFTATSDVIELNYLTTVEDYLNALKAKGEIDFDGYSGDYGYFITSVNGKAGQVISSTANSYEGYDWTFYIDFTTLEGDDGIYGSTWSTLEFAGSTLYSANYGVSGVPCVEGHTYALVYAYSNMSW